MYQETNLLYHVVSVSDETADTATITLEYPVGSFPQYVAGQYITIYFPETGTPEGKAYTISSAPSENRFTITVKAIGEFSRRLVGLVVGDTVRGSLPYGYFYSEATDTPLVFIAAGIGITPFRSMVVESLAQNPTRPITVLYSAKTVADIVFKSEFDALAALHSNFTIHYFVTREPTVSAPLIPTRISAEAILSRGTPDVSTEFFICGSIAFVRDLWRDMVTHGIKEEMISTEAFFSH